MFEFVLRLTIPAAAKSGLILHHSPQNRRLRSPLSCRSLAAGPSRWPLWLVFGLLFASNTGCTVWHAVRQKSFQEPRHYTMRRDEKHELGIYRGWAEQAFDEYAPASASPVYRDGFLSGFADFVFAGGSGEPPPVPPRKYLKIGYRADDRRTELDQWTAGFRAGALAADQGGYRRRVLDPIARRVVGLEKTVNKYDRSGQPRGVRIDADVGDAARK